MHSTFLSFVLIIDYPWKNDKPCDISIIIKKIKFFTLFNHSFAYFPCFGLAYGAGHLSVLESPKTIEFSKHDEMDSSDLSDFFAAIMGYSTHNSLPIKTVIKSPMDLPDKCLMVRIHGLNNLKLKTEKPLSDIDLIGNSCSMDSFSSKLHADGLSDRHMNMTNGVETVSIIHNEKNNFLQRRKV